jgi:hypothetical protein
LPKLVLIADSLDVDDVEIGDGSVARAVAQAVRATRRRPSSACLTPKFHDPLRSPQRGATRPNERALGCPPQRGGGLLKTWCRRWPFDPLLLRCFPSVSLMFSGETKKPDIAA